MVEDRRLGDAIAYVILTIGVLIVAFPVYLAFIASTQTATQIATSHPMSLLPGDNLVGSYRLALSGGKVEGGGTIAPRWQMLWVSFVTAMVIAVGTIALSPTDRAAEPPMSSALKPS